MGPGVPRLSAAALACVVLISLVAASGPAGAVPIQFHWTGEVDILFDPNGTLADAGLALGDPVTGRYTFESTTPDVLFGTYLGAVKDASVSVGSFSFEFEPNTDSGTQIFAYNDLPFAGGDLDRYGVYSRVLSLSPLGSWQSWEFQLLLEDYDGVVFQDSSLPLTPPDLSFFELADPRVQSDVIVLATDDISIGVKLHTLTTPEPSGLVLSAAGVALVALLKTKRRSRR